MKLVKFEAKGFKSFAERVSLNFDGSIVGIVGPNGSGKSNINDAIRWVLGERSIKALRGANAQEIIFSGSRSAPPADKASVSLTFDNNAGILSLPDKLITITRELERSSGENAYFINGAVAKLKDIEEIAMESGISKSSLAIISQGTIQNIAQASPEERRYIFEEAAGISKYKARKNEALRKLERVSENLEQILTVINELERQLAPLRRQADKARLFQAKRQELGKVEISLIVEDVAFFSKKRDELAQQLGAVSAEQQNLQQKVVDLTSELQTKTKRRQVLETEIHALSSKFQEVTDKLTNLEISASQVTERRKLIIEGQLQASSKGRLIAIREELEELNHKNHQYDIWVSKLETDITAGRAEMDAWQTSIALVNLSLDSLKRDIAQVKARISLLQDAEANRSHLHKGPKTILDNGALFPGLVGIVADQLAVETKHALAIETVLGNTLQHVVVSKADLAVKAINFLKANQGGRATFIPLDTIRPKAILPEHLNVLTTQSGFLGVASELVSGKPEHDNLRKFLLGNVLVTDSIDSAERLSRLVRNQYLIVSLGGDIVRPGGTMTGGEQVQAREMLGLGDQIRHLQDQLPVLDDAIQIKQTEAMQLTSKIGEKQLLINEWQVELAKVKEKRQWTTSQFATLKGQYEAETNSEFKTVEKTQTFESTAMLETQRANLKADLNARREAVQILTADLARESLIKSEFEKSLTTLLAATSTQMAEKTQADFVVKNALSRLLEEYELTYESARSQAQALTDQDEARLFVAKMRQEIKDLGHVNLDAIDAYEEVNSRHEELKAREEEIIGAKNTIESAINEMDQIIIARLDETVQSVNKEIGAIFQRMFGGGHAEVVYTDPKNLLETGIEVTAQPPGKTIKNLNLFSGGEKALVAISLLFAILKSRPLPLCILDEVEAALDEANVVRFATYLQELKAQTQFLVITHRVGTMARVDHLFGVTMQVKGVSNFLTVRLQEAQALLDKAV